MGLKLSPSNLELAFKTKPELQKYADRLRKLDTDGNGELELQEGKYIKRYPLKCVLFRNKTTRNQP
jgi:hypothetical protein